MSASALWSKHRGLAYAIAGDFYLPGAERQDVDQEALIGLWIAARSWDREKGASFPTFARLVIRRRLALLVQGALREKHRVLTDAARDHVELAGGVEPERVAVARDTLRRLADVVAGLTALERVALERIVAEAPLAGKVDDNSRARVRRKLRAAA